MPRLRFVRARPLAARAADRGGALIEEAAERSRTSARERGRRLLAAGRSIVQVAIAAPVAWLIATEVLGHPRPFFAPVAAIITLGITFGERGRRAAELAFGVALGIAVADLLVLWLGPGTLQLTLVVVLAMTAALLLGRGQLFATQAAVSAALVATLEPPSDGVSFARFLDALVGGGIALAVNALVLPANPLVLTREAAERLVGELAGTLEEVADALLARDRARVESALLRARGMDPLAAELAEAVAVSRETVRWAPPRRGARDVVDAYAHAFGQLDLAVRNVRVLARGSIRAVELDDRVPPEVAEALRDLARAVRDLIGAIERPEEMPRVHQRILRAAGRATLTLESTSNLSVSLLVAQIRSTAVDLLRAGGLGYEEAVAAVRASVRELEATGSS